ncbi:MAG TPA: ABC transporter ATP-binding protein [Longilinea sp.]|nr:ABC transporter ATP-binding protein [Longilinea sp.]
MAEKPVIVCEDLWHVYPNGVEALRGVSLTVNEGEYVAFVGQNGSGKTTLVKHFNGLLKPTRGKVMVNGQNTKETKVSVLSHKVGYVFQNPDDMLFCSSVEEEIAFGPKMVGAPEDETKQKVDAIINDLGLEPLRDAHPFALSLGDRQRLAVACALSLDPDVFVFDEPTTGQDFFGGESIMMLIDQLYARGKTIIIITHDMNLVAEHAKRVVVMSKGQAVLDGTPAKVYSNTKELSNLSLRPPQVTVLAQWLGCKDRTILSVNQMCDWLQGSYLPAGGMKEGTL